MARLDDSVSGAPVVLVPVRGGATAVTLVPLGRYRVTIAEGRWWLGPEQLFGYLGETRQSTVPLDFIAREGEIIGHRIDIHGGAGNALPMRRAPLF